MSETEGQKRREEQVEKARKKAMRTGKIKDLAKYMRMKRE
jgi:hypothetical protein